MIEINSKIIYMYKKETKKQTQHESFSSDGNYVSNCYIIKMNAYFLEVYVVCYYLIMIITLYLLYEEK